jgi:osmotically-inducible protein OsmY
MSTSTTTSARRLLVLVTAGLMLWGCNEKPPEARLQEAGQQLESATDNLDELNDRIESLRDDLEELKEQKRDLLERKQTLEQRVESRATDVALFRSVQSSLLAKEELEDTAVSVDVANGIVTLRGRVDNPEQQAMASSLAESITGVKEVRSRIRVDETVEQ